MNRTPPTVPVDPVDVPAPRQLPLPFLTADEVVELEVGRLAVDRAVGHAVAAGRLDDAAELARLGAQLAELHAANAAGVRASRR